MVKIIERDPGLLPREASERELDELLSELARNNSMIEDYSKRVEYETNRKIEETYRNWIRHYVNENVHLISLIEIKKAQGSDKMNKNENKIDENEWMRVLSGWKKDTESDEWEPYMEHSLLSLLIYIEETKMDLKNTSVQELLNIIFDYIQKKGNESK